MICKLFTLDRKRFIVCKIKEIYNDQCCLTRHYEVSHKTKFLWYNGFDTCQMAYPLQAKLQSDQSLVCKLIISILML